MASKRETLKIAVLLLGLLVTIQGCAPVPMDSQERLPAHSTEDLTPSQIELVVLHTNDNWGETEPCG